MAMATSSSSRNDNIKLRLIAWDQNSKSEVSTAGYATTLDLTLKAKKNWSSVVQHLCKKWSKVERIGSRLQLFELDPATRQPTLNYLSSFGSLSVGNSLGAHSAFTRAGHTGSIPKIHLYYHFATPLQTQPVFSGQNLLTNLQGSGADMIVRTIPKEIVYGQNYMGYNSPGSMLENTKGAIRDVVEVINGKVHMSTSTEQCRNDASSKSFASIAKQPGTVSAMPTQLQPTQHLPSSATSLSLPALRSSVNDLPLLLSSIHPPVDATAEVQRLRHCSSTAHAGGAVLTANSVPASYRDISSVHQQEQQRMDHPRDSVLMLGDDTMACLADLSDQSMLSPSPVSNPSSMRQDVGSRVCVMNSTAHAEGDSQYHRHGNTDGVVNVSENSIMHISDSVAHFLFEFGQESNGASTPSRDECDVSLSCKGMKRGAIVSNPEMDAAECAEEVGITATEAVTNAVNKVILSSATWKGENISEKRRRLKEEHVPAHPKLDEPRRDKPWAKSRCMHCVDTREISTCGHDSQSNLLSHSKSETPLIQRTQTDMGLRGDTPPESEMAVDLSESSGQGASTGASSTPRRSDQDHRLRSRGIPLTILRPNKRKPYMKRITPTFVSKLSSRTAAGIVTL